MRSDLPKKGSVSKHPPSLREPKARLKWSSGLIPRTDARDSEYWRRVVATCKRLRESVGKSALSAEELNGQLQALLNEMHHWLVHRGPVLLLCTDSTVASETRAQCQAMLDAFGVDVLPFLCQLALHSTADALNMDEARVILLCKVISKVCIIGNVSWRQSEMQVLCSLFCGLLDELTAATGSVLTVAKCLPSVLRAVSHVIYERCDALSESQLDALLRRLMALLSMHHDYGCAVSSAKSERKDGRFILWLPHLYSLSLAQMRIDCDPKWRDLSVALSAIDKLRISERWSDCATVPEFVIVALKNLKAVRNLSATCAGHCTAKALAKPRVIEGVFQCLVDLKNEWTDFEFGERSLWFADIHKFGKMLLPRLRAVMGVCDTKDALKKAAKNASFSLVLLDVISVLSSLMTFGMCVAATKPSSAVLSVVVDDFSAVSKPLGGGKTKGKRKGSEPMDVFAKVRLHSLHCLTAILRNVPRAFDNFWLKLLPNNEREATSKRPFTGLNVMTVIIYDLNSRVRNSAALFLQLLVQKCPIGKLAAAHTATATATAFTTTSGRALQSMEAIHCGLLHVVATEKTEGSLLHALRTLSTVVAHSHFHKLRRGLLPQLARCGLSQMADDHSDDARRQAASSLLAAVLCRAQYNEELQSLIGEVLKGTLATAWRWPQCEVRPVIGALVTHWRAHACEWWGRGLRQLVAEGLADAASDGVRVATLSLTQNWLSIVRVTAATSELDAVFGVLKLPHSALLFSSLGALCAHHCASVRTKALLVVGSLRQWHWRRLAEASTRQQIVDAVLSRAKDESELPNVRSLAFRCLAVLGVLLTAPKSAVELFQTEAVSTLWTFVQTQNKTKAGLFPRNKTKIRSLCRALWALSRLVDAKPSPLITLSAVDLCVVKRVTADFFESDWQLCARPCVGPLLMADGSVDAIVSALSAALCRSTSDGSSLIVFEGSDSSAHCDVVCHCLKTLGHIGSWLRAADYSHSLATVCRTLCAFLRRSDNAALCNAACFAAGHLVSNASITETMHLETMATLSEVFGALFELVDGCENWKLRTAAVEALRRAPSRRHYSFLFAPILEACFAVLTNLDKMERVSFEQNKHKSKLSQRVTQCLMHLLKLLNAETDERLSAALRCSIAANWQTFATHLLELRRELFRADEAKDATVSTMQKNRALRLALTQSLATLVTLLQRCARLESEDSAKRAFAAAMAQCTAYLSQLLADEHSAL